MTGTKPYAANVGRLYSNTESTNLYVNTLPYVTSKKSTNLYAASVREVHSCTGNRNSYRTVKEEIMSYSGSDLNQSQIGQTCLPVRKWVKKESERNGTNDVH